MSSKEEYDKEFIAKTKRVVSSTPFLIKFLTLSTSTVLIQSFFVFQLAQGQALTDANEETVLLVQKKPAELKVSDLQWKSLMSETSTLLGKMSLFGSQNMNATEYLMKAIDKEDSDEEDELDEELAKLKNDLETVKTAFHRRKEINQELDTELEMVNDEIRKADQVIKEYKRVNNTA